MSKIIEEPSQRNIIKISNDFAWAQMHIKEVSINIFFMLLTEIMMEDEELPEFDFAILDIEKKLGKKLNRKRENLDAILRDFLEKNIVLYNDTEAISLCKEAKIINEDNILFLRVIINPLLKDELLNLSKEFTTLNLQHLLKLRGINAKRMYMILKKMKGLGGWDTQLDTLKNILQPSKSFQEYKNFKAQALTSPIEQINNLEDKEMTISFKVVTKGSRKTRSIEFIIKSHAKTLKSKPRSKKKSQREKQKEILEEWLKKSEEQDESIEPNLSNNLPIIDVTEIED